MRFLNSLTNLCKILGYEPNLYAIKEIELSYSWLSDNQLDKIVNNLKVYNKQVTLFNFKEAINELSIFKRSDEEMTKYFNCPNCNFEVSFKTFKGYIECRGNHYGKCNKTYSYEEAKNISNSQYPS